MIKNEPTGCIGNGENLPVLSSEAAMLEYKNIQLANYNFNGKNRLLLIPVLMQPRQHTFQPRFAVQSSTPKLLTNPSYLCFKYTNIFSNKTGKVPLVVLRMRFTFSFLAVKFITVVSE